MQGGAHRHSTRSQLVAPRGRSTTLLGGTGKGHSRGGYQRAVRRIQVVVLTRLTRDVENALRARFISGDIMVAPSLDRALESCESAIIKAHQPQDSEAGTLRDWFTEALAIPRMPIS